MNKSKKMKNIKERDKDTLKKMGVYERQAERNRRFKRRQAGENKTGPKQ